MRRILSLLSVAIMLAAAGVVAQARWYELYDEAVAHIQRGEYTTAEAKLLQAQKLNRRSGRNVLRHGMLRSDYFPEFYLGYVALMTGRPEEAANLFAQARKSN